jgi:sec-independent protein translocase protein TatB
VLPCLLPPVFGFSFSELIVVVLVALVVMGPKDLPKMLRRVGQWAGKIRRMAADLRAQSGIDDALRSEGLADDIAEIRKLARGELDAVRTAATVTASELNGSSTSSTSSDSYGRGDDFYVVRDREYPRDGADAYGALPDNAIVYADGLPKSPHHQNALYRLGDESAVLPAEPKPAPEPTPQTPGAVGPTLMGVGLSSIDNDDPKPTNVVPTHVGIAPVKREIIREVREVGTEEPNKASS